MLYNLKNGGECIVENNNSNIIQNEENGSINFANDVLATIAGIACTEVEGIAGMSGGIIGGIGELLGRKNLTKGVKVELVDGKVKIDLFVVVEYGVEIHKVCMNVQNNVKKAFDMMTGMDIDQINVNVQGVKIDAQAADGEDK